MNICERLGNGNHEECPRFLKYDPQRMEPLMGKEATRKDTVFCICACHRMSQA